MAHPFRYVFEDSLYLGFSEQMPPDEGRKVFRITCPDFNSYFEIIETKNYSSPYIAKASHYANPFSQKVLEWFCDDRLLYEQAL